MIESIKSGLPEGISVNVEYFKYNKNLHLRISFKLGLDFEARQLIKKLKIDLDAEDLELGRDAGSRHYEESDSNSYIIFEKTIDGKTNWRRWVHYPDAIDTGVQSLLDEVASLVGQQEGSDSYEKYSRFYNQALREGIINEAEYREIESENYHASNGR